MHSTEHGCGITASFSGHQSLWKHEGQQPPASGARIKKTTLEVVSSSFMLVLSLGKN